MVALNVIKTDLKSPVFQMLAKSVFQNGAWIYINLKYVMLLKLCIIS